MNNAGRYVNPSPEVYAASNLIFRTFGGFRSGAELRQLAHLSEDPKVRAAAVTLDEHDEAVAKHATQRRPLMQPSPRPRNLDGSFVSRRFAAQVLLIGSAIRAARGSAPLGVVEAEAKREGAE
jgi:hypothetical protein